MAQRKTGLWVSSLLTVAVILLLAFRGLNFGIDFTGGVLVEVTYPQTVQLDEVREHLKPPATNARWCSTSAPARTC